MTPGFVTPGFATQRSGGRDRAILLITCVGLFMIQLDMTVVNVAVGAIQHDLATSTSTVTWVVDAYLVTFAAFMLGFGDVGDLFGRRRVFLAGLGAFTLASVGCASAWSVGWLIVFRAAQGVAGAAVMVSSLAVLVNWFDGPDRTRAIGRWSAVAGLALVVGPVAGGALVDGISWRAVFWVNVPVGVAGVVAGWRVLPTAAEQGGASEQRRIDWKGQLLAVAALATLAWGLEEGSNTGWTSAAGWCCLAAGALLVVAFLAVERRAAAPLVPLDLFRSAAFDGSNAASLLLNFSTLGLLFLLSLYFERVGSQSAVSSGWRIVPLFAAYAALAPWGGRVATRWGPRSPAALGTALAGAAGLAIPSLADRTAAVSAVLFVGGLGIGLALPALVTTAIGTVPPARSGLASGLNNTARQIGGTLGVALLGGVVASGATARQGIDHALYINAGAYLLAAVITVATLRAPARTELSPSTASPSDPPTNGRYQAGRR